MARLIDIEAPYKIEIELDGGKCHATVTAPTVDAVPVVRCKECKWFQANRIPNDYLLKGVPEYECRHWCGETDPTDYCSYGERKGGDE